ncbi:MAG: DUF1285 domain-containing protein [Desulfobacterota bacterium]|nr:DUF1285 domain-containing protein [Thermodesulfobacteriota bacterium]
MTSPEPLPPCMIFVAQDGKWSHEGAEISHRSIFLWLIQNLEKDEQGQYIVHLNNQKCVLEVEDTPLVVQGVDWSATEEAGEGKLVLTLNDERQEDLDPAALWLSRENVLYCLVKGGRIPARFLRAAYYQIANYIDEDDDGTFFLLLNGRKYPIVVQG